MATVATALRNYKRTSAEPEQAGITRSAIYLLRALPNEDIYFHTKRIDNSRLVREPDPKSKAECWSTIGAVCAVAAVLITSLVPSVAGITAGYQLQSLKQERQRLLDERRGLEAQEAALRGRKHLEQLASDRHMTNPKPEQVVHLNLGMSEGTVASLTSQPKEK